MNLNIEAKELKKILISVYKIAYSNEYRNIFFSIEVTEKEFIISANNNVMFIEKKTKKLEIIEPGKFVINAYVMNELCQKFENNINIKMNEDNVVFFNSGKSKNRINTINLDFFKKLNDNIKGVNLKLKPENFKKIIKQVSFAVQNKDGRSAFQGINLRTINNNLIATATDGSRIARKFLISNVEGDVDLIVPIIFFLEVFRLCEENLEKQIIFSDEKILIIIDKNTKILTKTFNEVFPNTESQLNQNIKTEIKCNCNEIIKAIERINVINEKNEIFSVIFKIKDEKFLLSSSNDNQIGYSEEEIISAKINGEDQTITLQTKYVLDVLRGFDKEQVLIKFSEENGPIIFKMNDDNTVIDLILPFWNY